MYLINSLLKFYILKYKGVHKYDRLFRTKPTEQIHHIQLTILEVNIIFDQHSGWY